MPKEIVHDLDPQMLLGYNVVGLLGNVDGRHPRRYLGERREVTDGRLVA